MTSRARRIPAREIGGRHAELLADRAVWGLSEQEAAELAEAGLAADPSFDLAAAAAHLAFARETPDPLPANLRDRIEADALALLRGPVVATVPPRRPIVPWLIAAAAAMAALLGWWNALRPAGTAPPYEAQREIALKNGAGVWAWQDFKHPASGEAPEVQGVRGDVVWDERAQRGFMRLAGLPRNDPSRERYQLWIVDERGLGQRISGGVFSISDSGEAVVPFTPDLPIHGAALFAVTIEPPAGVAVSDMKRRACVAVVTPPPPAKGG